MNRINFEASYKLHLCCDKKSKNYSKYIYFDGDLAVATDGHVLIIIPINEICNLSEDQKELLSGKYLDCISYENILKFNQIEITEKGIVAKKATKTGGVSTEEFTFADDVRYPNYKAILTDHKSPVSEIGIDPIRLSNLSKAAGDKIAYLTFNGAEKAIMVHFLESEAKGLIMPCAIE